MSRKIGLSRLDDFFKQHLDALPDPVSVAGNRDAQVAELTTAIQAVVAESQPATQPIQVVPATRTQKIIQRVLASKGRSVESLFRPNVGVFQYLEGATVHIAKTDTKEQFYWETLVITPDNYDELPHAMKCDISDLDNPETKLSEVMRIVRLMQPMGYHPFVAGQYTCKSIMFLEPLVKMYNDYLEDEDKGIDDEENTFVRMIYKSDHTGDLPVQYLLNHYTYEPADLKLIAIHCMKHMLGATIWLMAPDIVTTAGPYTLEFDMEMAIVLMDLIEKSRKYDAARNTALAVLESSAFQKTSYKDSWYVFDRMICRSEYELLECLLKVREFRIPDMNQALIHATIEDNYNLVDILLEAGANPFIGNPSAFDVANLRQKNKLADCSRLIHAFHQVAKNFGR
jgi:hypothetical protein